MSYQVSPKVKDLLNQILAIDEVQKALKFIEEDADNTLKDQLDFVVIQAPTFQEQERAAAYKKYYEDLGLEGVHLDEFGNTVGYMKGAGGGPKTLVEAHLDTVFPMGTKIEPRIEDGVVRGAPGIGDDTRGLVCLLSVIRALNATGIKTSGDVVFAGMVEEEGMGGLGGMKKYLTVNKDIEASLSVDGSSPQGIVYEATGMRTYEVTFHGNDGHASGAFAKIANALHAAARAVAKIADLQVPENPRTTFCVSNFHGGNDSGIHAFAKDVQIKFNFRSNSQEVLLDLDKRIFDCIQEACDEETARWGKDTITWTSTCYVDVGAGTQDEHAPIVEALHAVIEYLGYEPVWLRGGSTNANNPISMGIPAVCMGMGGTVDTRAHSLEEFFPIEGKHEHVQQTLLMLLMVAGIEGKTPSILNI